MNGKPKLKVKDKKAVEVVFQNFKLENQSRRLPTSGALSLSQRLRNSVPNMSIKEWLKHGKTWLDNEAQLQDIRLKKYTLIVLFFFLAVETFFVFLFAWWQATERHGFKLEEWSFKLLLGATILQISYMA